MTNLSQKEINENYAKSLIKLIDQIHEDMDATNKLTGTKHGFVMLMIRDPSPGNVDVAHNFNKDEDLIQIMELAIETIKKGLTKQTLNP